MKRICLAWFIFSIVTQIFGQTREILFDQIQKSDGVLHRVFSLYQDHKGFIWFRTAGNPGIKRYDGYKFESYLDSSGFFNSIMEDQRGLLWLGSSNGIIVFNPENEKSIHYYITESSQNSYSLNNVTKIIEDANGNIWCATANGLLKMKPGNKLGTFLKDEIFSKGIETAFTISVVKIKKGDSNSGSNQISEIVEDSRGRLWIGGKGSVYILNSENGSCTRIDDDVSGKSRFSDPFISSIMEENPDVFWVGTGNGVFRISNIAASLAGKAIVRTHLDFKQYLDNKLIMGLLKGDKNTIWVGTYLNGLMLMEYDKDRKPKFKEVYTDLLEPEGEGIRTIFSLMKDRTGLIWAGHQYGGIRKFDPEGNCFTSYKELVRLHFSNYDLNPIYIDEAENLWTGTLGGGLYKINKEEKVINYPITDDAIRDKSGNGVISLLEIEKGIFWIGAANGIWQFNAGTGRSRKLFTDTKFGELNNYVYDIQRINKYVLFTLWGEGLFVYNLQTEDLKRYKYDQNTGPGLKSNILFSICRTRDMEFYTGGSRGLTRFELNDATGEIAFLPPPATNAPEITETINKLYPGREGVLWCGTNNGLLKMDLHSGSIQRWMESDGLSFNIIRTLEEDGQGNLWLGTSNGLSMLNPVTGKITSFNKSKGLPIEIHGHHASFRDKEGALYFGGIGGYYCFRPDSITTNKMIPPVVITDFRLFNKPVKIDLTRKAILPSNISYTENIKLRYNQNDISFEFAALDYYRSSENRYACRLEGYQEDWIETDATNRIATYTNLNPGRYTFQVKGSNNSGIWNDQGASVQIVIRPPFWKTTLAYIVYVVLFLLLLRGYIFWRTWKLRKEKALLELQVTERTRQIEEQKEELLQQKEELQTTLENLRKTQDQLIESEKMAALGGLVAGVAHEINTPVGIGITAITTLMDDVQNMAKRFKRNEISRGDFKDFLQSTNDTGELIQKNLERTASLVQSFKQISVDQVTEQKRLFRLKSYLDDIILSLYPKYKQKKIVFNTDCDADLELNSYPGAFAQIFTNLIINSIVHGFHERDRGTVNIGVSSTGKMLHIEYRDDGHGIAKKDLPHIFEPFYTSDERKGTGLGLNIIYNLIRQKLHGNITCESEPGTGVLFKIEIPSG
ncbi:MAG: hypothetical protein JW830_07890 [Bacteroidales bacterium]|nr:hypothetical protein [Bacteroidales bacterium]